MKRGRPVLFVLLLFFLVAEIALRLFMPQLGADLFEDPVAQKESYNLYNNKVGYEPKPLACIRFDGINNMPETELLNSEGFRGPEHVTPKPDNIYRVLLIGDSVVQSLLTPYSHSWGKILEKRLQAEAALPAPKRTYEVINAGVGGYVSWQALRRLRERGLKYEPDIVLVLVGWNDMLYSYLPFWSQDIDLSKIEKAWASRKNEMPGHRKGLLSKIRMSAYRVSYIARLVRAMRNFIWNAWRDMKLIKQRSSESGMEFNEEALRLYISNLEEIHDVTKAGGARMALITWPTIINLELLSDRDINRRIMSIYYNFPSSIYDIWKWYLRYTAAQREFAASHPDIVLIDAAKVFGEKGKKERLALFFDLAHPNGDGNSELAEVILGELKEQGIIPK